MIKIQTGSNRCVIIGKKYVYKLPIGKRGRTANKAEYENAKDNPDCAVTEKRGTAMIVRTLVSTSTSLRLKENTRC